MKKLLILVSFGAVLSAQTVINGYRDWSLMSAPGNPGAGYIREFGNSATGLMGCLTSGGVNCFSVFSVNHAYTYTSGTLTVDFSTYTSATVTPSAGGVNPTLSFTAPTSNLAVPLELILCNYASGTPAVWTLPGNAAQIGAPVRAGDCVRTAINYNATTTNFEGSTSGTSTPSILDLTAERAAPIVVPAGGSIWPDSTDHDAEFLNSSSVLFKMFKSGQDCNPVTGVCASLGGVTVAQAATASTIVERNSSAEVIAVNTVATGKTAVDTNSVQTMSNKTFTDPDLGGSALSNTVTAGTSGVTANHIVQKSTENPIRYNNQSSATAMVKGIARTTATVGNTFELAQTGIIGCVVEGSVTSGHYWTVGSTDKSKCLDTTTSALTSICSAIPVGGVFQASGTDGQTVSVSIDWNLHGAQVCTTDLPTVPVTAGGTGLATLTAHAVQVGEGTSTPAQVGPDASTTKVLTSAGASADPAFQNISLGMLPTLHSQCTVGWGGSGTSFALTSGDDAIVNNGCYNDSGGTRTITAVKCLSDNGSNTTTINPTMGSAGTGTTILSGALTCGSGNAMSATGTVSNASWTTGTGIDPAMGGTLTGTHIIVVVDYSYAPY